MHFTTAYRRIKIAVLKLSALLLLALHLCQACDCFEPSVQAKQDHAELILGGTIVELRDSSQSVGISSDFARNTKKIVVFRVSRVWKGNVGRTFEMPGIEETSACIGFWPDFLKVGEDLLVYASRFGGSQYVTSIRRNHKPAKDAGKDFRTLGPGGWPSFVPGINSGEPLPTDAEREVNFPIAVMDRLRK